MSVTTQWVDSTPSLIDNGGVASDGNATRKFRYRRVDGQLLWAFKYTIGSSTVIGTGLLAFHVEDDFPVADDTTTIYTPAAGLITDASAGSFLAGSSGVLQPVWSDNITIVNFGGIGIPVQSLFVIGYFANARLSATAPITLAAGDTILGGNALEALNT